LNLHQVETPQARPVDALLASYAAGSLNAPLQALVGSHLELSRDNRAFVAALEDLAGLELVQAVQAPLPGRDRMLEAILSGEPDRLTAAAPPASDAVLPAPLLRLVGRGSPDIAWRFKLPGIKEYRVAETEAGEAVLYWVKAGRRLPQHTHEGDEVTLLLAGGFTDPLGHYRRGDIAIADADLDHTPVADADEDCICFAVTDAPLQLTGPVMRLLRKVFRQ
jgi:putative transcriptional regulator